MEYGIAANSVITAPQGENGNVQTEWEKEDDQTIYL